MANRRLIEQEWEHFASAIGLERCSVQRNEMRRAFFAGSLITMAVISENISEGTEVTADDKELLHGVKAEHDEWRERLRRGEV